MRRIAVSAARERIADVIAEVARRRQRIVLTRHGREVGAIVPLEDLDRLRTLEAAEMDEATPTLAAHRSAWRRVADQLRHHRHT